ncbi:hypothetical protein [Nocardioides sp. InS609-2]|uniref:hypothetical protein n=1 Tax=Nocardioides sp. InS609-2 TaxID=2760705 RepID=UPI0020BF1C9C|nr:hypothetical protein [Nocardioides sp. InS609-2]
MTNIITTTDTSGRHPINVGNLVMGVAFLGLVGVWAAISADVIEGSDIRWLLPVPWVLAGLAGLIAVAFGGGRRAKAVAQADYQPYAAPYSTPYGEEAATGVNPTENKEQDR